MSNRWMTVARVAAGLLVANAVSACGQRGRSSAAPSSTTAAAGSSLTTPDPMAGMKLAADGTWSVDVDFSTPGRWHLIADVTPMVPGGASARVALGVDVDGYDVTLDGSRSATAAQTLTFTVSHAGQPATGITGYLGAGGHLVALQEQTLGFTYLHPEDGPRPEPSFTARAPQAGRHRLFLQFATGETVHTAAFTVDVA